MPRPELRGNWACNRVTWPLGVSIETLLCGPVSEVSGWRRWTLGAGGPVFCCRRRCRQRASSGSCVRSGWAGLACEVGWAGCQTKCPAVGRSMGRSDARPGAQHPSACRRHCFGPCAARGCVPEPGAPFPGLGLRCVPSGRCQGRSPKVAFYPLVLMTAPRRHLQNLN